MGADKRARRRSRGRGMAVRKGTGKAGHARRARGGRRRSRPKTDEERTMGAARLVSAMNPNPLRADPGAASAARHGRGKPPRHPPPMVAFLAVLYARPGTTFRFLAGRALCPWAETLYHTTPGRRIW